MTDTPDLEKDYVLGFAIEASSISHQCVILIEKTKPAWQKGRWNGVGGHMKEGETPLDSMVREFREETGVDTDPAAWVKFGQMTFPDGSVVHCFIIVDDQVVSRAQTQLGGEMVRKLNRNFIRDHITPLDNINWLIEMGLAKIRNPNHPELCVSYGG